MAMPRRNSLGVLLGRQHFVTLLGDNFGSFANRSYSPDDRIAIRNRASSPKPFSGSPGYVRVLSSLPLPFRRALLSMYNGEQQLGSDGERHSLTRPMASPQSISWRRYMRTALAITRRSIRFRAATEVSDRANRRPSAWTIVSCLLKKSPLQP